MILAIDPGTTESAFVILQNKRIEDYGKLQNEDFLPRLRSGDFSDRELFIEMIASYGMPVGKEVFETCVWIGRFQEAYGGHATFVYRKDVKLHLCQSPRANDATIRQAIIDRYGPGKEKAIGKKASPGPLYGVSGDVWAALAIAITAQETLKSGI